MSFIISQAVAKASRVPPEPKKKIYIHTKKLLKSAKMFPEAFADLDSTKYSEGVKKPNETKYEVTPEYIEPLKASIQNRAIEGRHGIKKAEYSGHYHNGAHFDLISQLVPLRTAFRHPNNDKARQ